MNKFYMLVAVIIVCFGCESNNVKLYKEYIECMNDRDENSLKYILTDDFKYKFLAVNCSSVIFPCELNYKDYIAMKVTNDNYVEKIESVKMEEMDNKILAIVKFKNLEDVYLEHEIPEHKLVVTFSNGMIREISQDTLSGYLNITQKNWNNDLNFGKWLNDKYPEKLDSLTFSERSKILLQYYQYNHGNGSVPDEEF